MNKDVRTKILWINNTIESLKSLVDDGVFTETEKLHVIATIKALEYQKLLIR